MQLKKKQLTSGYRATFTEVTHMTYGLGPPKKTK